MGEEKESKKYTRKEVEEHNNVKTSWIVLHNKVYDISKFLDEHPGGVEVLLEHAGSDATEDFEDVGHSTDAREMKDTHFIGDIVESEHKDYNETPSWAVTGTGMTENKDGYINVVFAVVFGFVAFFLYRAFM